jgi:hypothetical protein
MKTKLNDLQITGIILGSILAVIFVLGMFVVDIGINSKYFIEKDFNKMSEYVLTGNCDAYQEKYVLKENKYKTDNYCTKVRGIEKEYSNNLVDWKLNLISYDFGNNTAQIQTTLIPSKGDDSIKKLILKREDFRWKPSKDL